MGAVKSAIGLARNLWVPPGAKEGAEPLRGMPTRSAAECARRLERAEEVLRRNAEQADAERTSWIPHLANLALNAAGAVIVAEGFDEGSGYGSGALGLAVGEARIWSHPWQARGALEEYERRFPEDGVPRPPPTTWRLEPWRAGGRLVVAF